MRRPRRPLRPRTRSQPPRITALRRAGPGQVEVVLDGRKWRTVSDSIVARCGLRADLPVDRPLARSLARQLRHERASPMAGRARRSRPLSEHRRRERLRSRGVRPDAEQATLAMLSGSGLVDDVRLACGRALALAERGWGDAAIEARLAAEGLTEPEIGRALAELDPEPRRAAGIIGGLPPRKGWALLQRRGFGPETIESVIGALDEDVLDGLG